MPSTYMHVQNYTMLSLALLPVHLWSLKRICYSVWSTLFLLNVFTALEGFYLLSLQLVLCCVVALKVAPHIVHSAIYVFLLVL